MNRRSLGVMVRFFRKKPWFIFLTETGKKAGFEEVIFFTPASIDFSTGKIKGHLYAQNKWITKRVSFPSIIYDIGIYTRVADLSRAILLEKSAVPFVGYTIGDKVNINYHLKKSSAIRPYIIPTQKWDKDDSLWDMLGQYNKIILKPVYSFGGKGIFILERMNTGIALHQNQNTKLFDSYSSAMQEIKQITEGRKYLIQPWLDIRSKTGRVADHRTLIQKDKTGNWQLRTAGTRIAPEKNITSNLKTGAKIMDTLEYLTGEHGHEKGQELYQKLKNLSYQVAYHLEKSYRKRFVEFGIDFAVDREGRIFIIEVNIKPGRRTLTGLAGSKLIQTVREDPIYYAWELVSQE